jgi:hypothetical protein
MSTGSDITPTRVGFPAAKALVLAGVVVLCAGGGLIFFAFDPTKVSIFPPCLFHEWTGLDCPGCGAQRALHQLLHGNFIAALRLNAMFVVSLPLLAWFGPQWISRGWKGEPIAVNTKWLTVYLVTWLVFAILRDLPVPIFAWFAA